ncbi:MAG: tetratricopeptide repeat protein [Nitrospinae bacterium]|nr:tetratricopeptide repeat protein [Nitrospinota bacterium]MBL7019562.1 tetratricopeptide repeat protein [Nitrospinaceae bacterium]
MSTIITIIIAIAVLAVLGKVFFSGTSGPSRRKEGSADSGETSASPEKGNKNPSAVKNMGASMLSDMGVKGASLFRPPPEPTLFTGRKEVQKKIMGQVSTAPAIIGINGHPGVGKTCLAITLIKKFSPQFTNNCLFIDMQGDQPNPPSAEDIMRRIILRFHPSQPLPTDNKKLAKLYRVALKAHKGILILDNAAGTKQVKPLVPPRSWLMIVTSTKPVLIPNIVAAELDPMETLESQTLLTRWAPKISPTIKEISHICKGLPMALEIIGKLFTINSTMAPDYFTKKFIEVRERFGEDVKGDFVVGIRAAITLSYNMLPDKAAVVLKKLSIFPGSFTANAVSFICEDTKNLSLTGLEKYGLVQYNLNSNRYYLHPLIKSFVRPLLTPGDRNMTEKRLATEFMNVLENAHLQVEKGGKEAIKGLRLFDLELENIKAGMEWSRKYCDKDKEAAQICSAYTENGATLISQRLSPTECIQWFEAALTAARQLEDKEAERTHLLNLGCQYALSNQSLEATNTLQSALSFCKKEGDVEGQKIALQHLTRLSLTGSDHALTIGYIEEHIGLTGNGNEAEEFKLLVQLTKSCVLIQEYNKAVHSGEQAMDLISLNNDKALHIILFHNLGEGYMKTGEESKALEIFEHALKLCQAIPKHPLLTELTKLAGEAAVKTGDVPGALKILLKGLETIRQNNNLTMEGALLIQISETHIGNQSEDQAFGYLEEALNVSKKINDRPMGGKVLWMWSKALTKSGNIAAAISQGLEALKIYEELNNPEASDLRAQIDKWSGN